MYDHGRNKYTRDNVKGTIKAAALSERRGTDRHIFTASAEVIELNSGTRFSTRTTDLSVGGCFVDSLTPFEVGTKVRVSARRDKALFEALGTVVYSQGGLGMGIAFSALGPEQQAILDQWLGDTNESSREPRVAHGSLDKKISSAPGNERAVLARLVQLMISKGVISEAEGTSIFNDSVLF
jgi:hypothetical protein